jgi:hypothetical protein
VDVDPPKREQGWDYAARKETETERLDRNWGSLLQELRVVHTSVQLLTGLLLLGFAFTGVTVVIFDAVAGHIADVIARACAWIALAALWVALPLWMRSGSDNVQVH